MRWKLGQILDVDTSVAIVAVLSYPYEGERHKRDSVFMAQDGVEVLREESE